MTHGRVIDQVIVHERGHMDDLDRRRHVHDRMLGLEGIIRSPPDRSGGEKHKCRPDALAGRLQ